MPEYDENLQKFYSSWIDYTRNWNQLFIQYNANLADSISKTFEKNNTSFASLASEDIRVKMRKSFDKAFREEMKDDVFIESLSKTMDSWLALSEFYEIYKNLI